jgi:hypothetical protein
MRRLGAKALAWSALAMASAGAAGGTGCKATRATELVPGVSTQMVVTKDLNVIRIDLEANGIIKSCNQYQVAPGGKVQLPSTLGVIPATSPNTTVTVTIRGYDVPGAMGTDVMTCAPESEGAQVAPPTAANAAVGNPRIIRRSIQTYVDGHILFLPMPLSYACQDVDCSAMGAQFACKGGLCLDSGLDATTLADYDPTLLDGTGLCFSPMDCLSDAVPATLVDADKCIYGFPSWDNTLAGTGANVRVFYKDITWRSNGVGGYEPALSAAGEAEILNEDPVEGFTLVNAADAGLPEAAAPFPGVDAGPVLNPQGQLIKLATGLCSLVKAGTTPPAHPVAGAVVHTISDVQIASLCPPKEPLLPICSVERKNTPQLPDGGSTADGMCNVAVPMDPAASAVYLVADQSVYMHGAYGASGSAQALSLSLSDPVFKRTFAGFKFLSDMNETDCTTATTSYLAGGPGYLPTCTAGSNCTFDLAADLQPLIANALSGWVPSEGPGTVPCSGMGMGSMGCAANQFCYQRQCYTPNPLDLQAAMRPAGAYKLVQNFLTQSQIATPNIAGVMFIVNRAPVAGAPPLSTEGGDCTTAPTDVAINAAVATGDSNSISPAANSAQVVIENEALNALATSNFHTYFVVLSNDDGSTEALQYFQQIAMDVPQAVTTLDATALSGGIPTASGAKGDVASFLDSVTKLGTCLYDLPTGVASGTDPNSVEVSFSPPGLPPATCKTGLMCVPNVANCTAASEASSNPPDGWSYDGANRLRICGNSCDTLRQYTILAAQTGADLPVTIASKCTGSSGTGTSGGGSSSGGTTGQDATTTTLPDSGGQ